MQKNKTSGFTLIELLVVIAIIGMLSSVVLASMNSARVKARDARRLADMKQIQAALELYNNDKQQYPAEPSPDPFVEYMTADLVTPGYITALPKDPSQTGWSGYRYKPSTDRQSYTLLVKLEKNNAPCKIVEGTPVATWANYADCY